MIYNPNEVAWSKISGSKIRSEEYCSELYEEANKLKESVNRYKEENIKLRTRILQCANAIAKKDKVIRELYQRTKSEVGLTNKKLIEIPEVTDLKRQLKEIQETLNIRNAELEEMKSSMKMSKIKELELKLRAMETECAKLKEAILNLLKNQSDTISPEEVAELDTILKQQNTSIENITKENENLLSSTDSKEEELNKYKEAAVQLDKRVGQAENINKENIKIKRSITESKKEIERIKKQIEIYYVEDKDKEPTILKNRIAEMKKKQSMLSEEIHQKDLQIEKLDQKAKNSPSKDLQHEIYQTRKKLESCNFYIF